MKNTQFEIRQSIRRTWGELKPTTRVKDSKKKYSRKQKHKQKEVQCEKERFSPDQIFFSVVQWRFMA